MEGKRPRKVFLDANGLRILHDNFVTTRSIPTDSIDLTVTCYDSETEILTSDGWMPFSELTTGHNVATLEWQDLPSEGKLVFRNPSRVVKSSYKGKLVRIRGPKTDLLVTPEHRCLIKNRDSWSIKSAKDLTSRCDGFLVNV